MKNCKNVVTSVSFDRPVSRSGGMVELSPEHIDEVSGGLIGGLIGAGLAIITAVVVDNATNGSLADDWYRLTH